jgi:Tfp pilus assembly protein PilN
MTTLQDRPKLALKPKGKAAGATVLTGGLPQVNLLPPEVRAARGLQQTKRYLVIALAATLVVCVGVVGWSKVEKASADSEYQSAQDDTVRLQGEQKKYAEVPKVLGALGSTQIARQIGMSTDIDWQAYIGAITAVLPKDVSIDTLTVAGDTPMQAAKGGAEDPLQPQSVGTISFTGRTVTVPDTAAWIKALNSVPGFAGAWVSATQVAGDEHGDYYSVASSVQLLKTTYTHNYDVTTDAKGTK